MQFSLMKHSTTKSDFDSGFSKVHSQPSTKRVQNKTKSRRVNAIGWSQMDFKKQNHLLFISHCHWKFVRNARHWRRRSFSSSSAGVGTESWCEWVHEQLHGPSNQSGCLHWICFQSSYGLRLCILLNALLRSFILFGLLFDIQDSPEVQKSKLIKVSNLF